MSGEEGGRCVRWLPAPFPDETLHSIFSRYHKLSGHGDYRRSLEELTGGRTYNSFHDTPSFLKRFSDRAQGVEVYSLDNLVKYHTAYPYIRRFLLGAQVSAWHERIKGGMRRSGGGQGLGFAHIRGQILPRFCSKCIEDDLKLWGQPYWHRVHQLPGVWICPLHSEVLACVDDVWLAKDQRRLFLPDDSCLVGVTKHIDVEGCWDFLLSVSQKSSILLLSDSELFSLSYAHGFTRRVCECHGLISKGFASSKQLADKISDFLDIVPHGGEFRYLHPIVRGELPAWVLEVLRATHRYRFPLEYLVLWKVLGVSLNDEGLICGDGCCLANKVTGDALIKHKRNCPKHNISQLEFVRRREEYLNDENRYSSRRRSYKWLLKHDRDWLAEQGEPNQSGRRRGYSVEKWKQRDTDLAESIVAVAEFIRAGTGPPVRVTIGAILRQLGLSRGVLYYLDRLPKCVAVLEAVQESSAEFARRRLSSTSG